MSNVIDLGKLPISDSSQVVNIIALNEGGNIIKSDLDAYSKLEVDSKFNTVEAEFAKYYTKGEVNAKLENITVDLTGYATEEWVRQQDYATNSDVDEFVLDRVGQVEQRFYDYYTKEEVDTKLDLKQDALVSGITIKTINGESLIGEGDITVQGGGDMSDYYTKGEIDSTIGDINNILSSI